MRYLPLTPEDRHAMLARIGVADIEALFADVPEEARYGTDKINLPNHMSEFEVEQELTWLAQQNITASDTAFFCGAGAYKHHIPASVDHIIQRSEFLTSYTPYQPEITQGTLQYLFEFQTQVAQLTGMDVANASMWDGSTATAEAVMMARRIAKRKKAVISSRLHPQYYDVVENMSDMSGGVLYRPDLMLAGDENLAQYVDAETACVVVQYPDVFGHIQDFTSLAETVHAAGALLIVVVTEAISFGALTAPGDMGADIVVAEGQSIGNPLNFGGPYVGLFATRKKYLRQMPGRLCGQTVDAEGKRGYVLTLSTREQHIRRDKATSNICTNSGLCALAFTAHMTLLGGAGLAHLARLNHERAQMLEAALSQVAGVEIINETYFNEFTIRLPRAAAEVVEALVPRGVLAGVPVSRLIIHPDVENLLLVAATETCRKQDIDKFAYSLQEVLS